MLKAFSFIFFLTDWDYFLFLFYTYRKVRRLNYTFVSAPPGGKTSANHLKSLTNANERLELSTDLCYLTPSASSPASTVNNIGSCPVDVSVSINLPAHLRQSSKFSLSRMQGLVVVFCVLGAFVHAETRVIDFLRQKRSPHQPSGKWNATYFINFWTVFPFWFSHPPPKKRMENIPWTGNDRGISKIQIQSK